MNPSALTIVLVHGGFVDGSGWEGVYGILKKQGFSVAIVQNPTTSLADDVAFTKRVIAAQPGKTLLVGHSYGGVVITEAGTDPNVAGLVYVAAFAPDKGESVASLIKNPPPGAPVPPILPPQDGFLLLDPDKFAASFAADVGEPKASFMAASQVPWGVDALAGEVHCSGMEVQAELVSGRHRRQDDPAPRAARDVAAGRVGRHGSGGEPCGLRVSTAGSRVSRREGGRRTLSLDRI
jgi:pimeloyl-ACP methyl ester carboxylesterase